MESDEKKICPLLSISPGGYYDCAGKQCAWWVGDRCAVAVMARDAEARLLELERQELHQEWRNQIDVGLSDKQ